MICFIELPKYTLHTDITAYYNLINIQMNIPDWIHVISHSHISHCDVCQNEIFIQFFVVASEKKKNENEDKNNSHKFSSRHSSKLVVDNFRVGIFRRNECRIENRLNVAIFSVPRRDKKDSRSCYSSSQAMDCSMFIILVGCLRFPLLLFHDLSMLRFRLWRSVKLRVKRFFFRIFFCLRNKQNKRIARKKFGFHAMDATPRTHILYAWVLIIHTFAVRTHELVLLLLLLLLFFLHSFSVSTELWALTAFQRYTVCEIHSIGINP